MRKVIGGLCIFVVAMQILIGVPLAVCCAFFLAIQGGSGPIAVEVHAGPRLDATIPPAELRSTNLSIVPPPNMIPEPAKTLDHPILKSRDEHGSPLAGTVFAECVPGDEQQLFVAALEKIAAETPVQEHVSAAIPDESRQPCGTSQLLCHLYAMAEIDEQAGEFERADQWRGLARELRGKCEK